MTWLVHLPGGTTVRSDQFTISDMETIEEACDMPWSAANPFRKAKAARAFLRAAYVTAGMTKDEAADTVDALTMRQIKYVFEYEEDPPEPAAGETEGPPLGESSPRSSSIAAAPTTGHRTKRARSA